MQNIKEKLIPLVLTPIILIIDQISKLIIVVTLKLGETLEIIGDFFRLRHIRNTNIVFGIGGDWPPVLKVITTLIAPLLIILLLFIYYFKAKIPRQSYRWLLAAILGGALGNISDRLFRMQGVVDFLDVKTYGLFGFERWPTFNIADSTIVVSIFILIVLSIIHEIEENRAAKKIPS